MKNIEDLSEAKFYVEHQTDDYVYIVDTGIEEKCVRADAKTVVSYLFNHCNLGQRRIIYHNRVGKDNEIKHQKGNYICCGVGHAGIELPRKTEDFLKKAELLKEQRGKIKGHQRV